MLSPILFAAAVMSGIPDLPPPTPAPAGEENSRPAPETGQGGPYEPAEEETHVIVEAEPAAAARPFMLAPDPELERRYAPRERAPLNRLTIPF